mgnify:CR=1 FL=1
MWFVLIAVCIINYIIQIKSIFFCWNYVDILNLELINKKFFWDFMVYVSFFGFYGFMLLFLWFISFVCLSYCAQGAIQDSSFRDFSSSSSL